VSGYFGQPNRCVSGLLRPRTVRGGSDHLYGTVDVFTQQKAD